MVQTLGQEDNQGFPREMVEEAREAMAAAFGAVSTSGVDLLEALRALRVHFRRCRPSLRRSFHRRVLKILTIRSFFLILMDSIRPQSS